MAYAVNPLPCAYFNNVELATQEFRTLCPASHYIIDVIPVRYNRVPYCRWTVRYVARNLNHSGGTNAKTNFELLKFHPINSYIYERGRCEMPPCFVITYAVECTSCQKDFSNVTTKFMNGYSPYPNTFSILLQLEKIPTTSSREILIQMKNSLFKELIATYSSLRSFPLVEIISIKGNFIYIFSTLKDRKVTPDKNIVPKCEEEITEDLIYPKHIKSLPVPKNMKANAIMGLLIFIGQDIEKSLASTIETTFDVDVAYEKFGQSV